MPKATDGFLLECDATVKQIVLMYNDRIKRERGESKSIVITELDGTHLFLTPEPDVLRRLRAHIDSQLEESRNPKSVIMANEGTLPKKFYRGKK